MNIFILSAGVQNRFPVDYLPKQLLVFKNETLMERQHRQLGNQIPTVITKNPKIKEQCSKWFEPENNSTVLDSFYSVRHLWNKRVVYLLGDVFYSDQLISQILSDSSDLKFWLNGSEIFSIAFNPCNSLKVEQAIRDIAKEKLAWRRSNDRKLWHLYRKLNQSSINKHIIFDNDITCRVNDHTTDVDSLVQYEDLTKLELYSG